MEGDSLPAAYRVEFEMAEDTIFRFALVGKLARMKYGSERKINQLDALKAWPPTGDHDTSFEGAFRAMALAFGGNRPETPYTTEERILNDLDPSFRVERDYYTGDWIIRRSASACPRCHGVGSFEMPRWIEEDIGPTEYSSDEAVIACDRQACDCKPMD